MRRANHVARRRFANVVDTDLDRLRLRRDTLGKELESVDKQIADAENAELAQRARDALRRLADDESLPVLSILDTVLYS